MEVTVVVPTYGRGAKLADSLDWLLVSDGDGVPFDAVHQYDRHERPVVAISRANGAANCANSVAPHSPSTWPHDDSDRSVSHRVDLC